MIGVNLAGAEFGYGPRFGHDYIYPNERELDYFKEHGVDLVRLPFKWERVQPTLDGELNQEEVARIRAFLDDAAARDMKVVLDLHNYGRYGGKVLGSDEVPVTALGDFWAKLVSALKGHPAIYGFGIMNEPHDMGSPEAWPLAAQSAVDAIRATGSTETILVGGTGWSSAMLWQKANSDLLIHDPLGNLKYEAHVYFDDDHTGTYDESFEGEGAYPHLGVERLQPFLSWLEEHRVEGFIGEFGVPGDDPRWLDALDKFVDEVQADGLDATAWAAGPWWGDYPLSLEPANGEDKPQLSVLTKFAFAPPAMTLSNPVVSENAPGALVSDIDFAEGGNVEGLRLTVSDPRFAVVTDDDGHAVLRLAEGVGLDFEQEHEVALTLIATNARGLTNVQTVSIGVSDVPGNTIVGTAAGNLIDESHSVSGQPPATAENDTLSGLGGNDILAGGAGPDLVNGGDGTDTARYVSSTAPVDVSLRGQTGRGGDAEGDRLVAIENLTGSSLDDRLEGGTDANRLDGGKGSDTASYESSSAGVTINLNTWFQSGGDADGDQLVSIENPVGSDFDDDLTGNSAPNTLEGSGGADRLDGWSGADRLVGGPGDDMLIGGVGADTFVFAEHFGRDVIADFGANDTIQFDPDVFADFEAVRAASVQDGADVTIAADADQVIVLKGVALSSLTADDFLFAG